MNKTCSSWKENHELQVLFMKNADQNLIVFVFRINTSLFLSLMID